MNRHTVSVVVGIAAARDVQPPSHVREALHALPGIARVSKGARGTRLVLVDYDRTATSARQILEALRGRGLDACLIGL